MIICPEVFWLLLRKSQVSKLNIAIFCISISQSSAACVEKIINSHSQKSKWKERKRESRPFEKKRGFRLDKSSRKYVQSSHPHHHHHLIIIVVYIEVQQISQGGFLNKRETECLSVIIIILLPCCVSSTYLYLDERKRKKERNYKEEGFTFVPWLGNIKNITCLTCHVK